ncbi:hypothetical protein PA598K_03798 [Paenibacillus sp. 598K]|uniref:hypothetical protein n=1 Tax=Paenibacillus sp. 598K TaxID=1117987 RepID=UPI000FFAA015|nr:hypothetical protein [Paenibacillus sp. 598K]GBF75394.1 hypothetical protein PA598K_03798 [Paenibacillus sp. 598K]
MIIQTMRRGAALLILSALLAACGQNEAPANNSSGSPEPSTPPPAQEQQESANADAPADPVEDNTEESAEETEWGDEGMPPTAMESAKTVMRALSTGNMETISSWAHKDKGVRFSPGPTIDPEADVVIDAEALATLMSDDEVRTWRGPASSDEAIEMTYADYHRQYVYDRDYADATPLENETKADSLGNLLEVYPADTYAFVEYYVEGDGGWSLVRLVFEKFGMDHALVAIIHDEQA